MKLYKNKKGGEGVNWWIALMVISVLFLVIWLVISGRIFGGFSETITASQVERKLESCMAKGEKAQLDGTPYPDRDDDGLPDYCDNCPDTPNFGEGAEDKDGDGFPKGCCVKYETGLINKKQEEICENDENDKVYGPKKLILAYITPKKS